MSGKPWEFGWGAIEALAVCGALLAAGYAVVLERRADRKMRADYAQRIDDERRSHASQVAVWPSGAFIPDPDRAPKNYTYPQLTIRNSSVLPIAQVDVHVVTVNEDGTHHGVTFLETFPVLEPGETKVVPLSNDLQFGAGHRTPLANYHLQFLDANGHEWIRDGSGHLSFIVPGGPFSTRGPVADEPNSWWKFWQRDDSTA